MNTDKLKGILPDNLLNEIANSSDITNELRLAHFLAQCGHESGNFTVVSENLNYSASGLLKVFPKYFTEAEANQYQRRPEQIANRVYANRMGNGCESLGDGYKFRGRGYIQLTGKDNYKKFSTFIGEDCVTNPDLVATKYPLASAVFFFTKNNLWVVCDKGATPNIVKQVTLRVNGGVNGLADRQKKFEYYYKLLV